VGAAVKLADVSMADRILGPLRLVTGFTLFIGYSAFFFVICMVLLPSRVLRIKAINYYGKLSGSTAMWLSGCPLTIEGRHELDGNRPALYISNHTSIVDLFLGMWLSPVGTVGVAKKEVVWYPLMGQMYLLSGHLRIDRGNSAKAVESLKDMAQTVKKHGLSIWMWPEGTRSRDGRLLPFKKGIVHMALQTRLPIVPVAVIGAQGAWVKNSLIVQRVPITVRCLPAIDTTDWTADRVDEYVELLHRAFADTLPPEQKPLAQAA
jgi:lysophosphatidate acyltransferase